MKLYCSIGETHLKETDCIGISASPETLRAVAKFLLTSAKELEEMGDEFSHLHLMDEWKDWSNGYPDIQIFNENTGLK